MAKPVTEALAIVVLATSLVVACGTSSPRQGYSDEGDPGGATGTGSGTSGGSGTGNGTGNGQPPLVVGDSGADSTTPTCTTNDQSPGCSCGAPDTTGACWTGPAALRHVGVCKDGTMTCIKQGEFAKWGPCSGEVLPGSPGVTAACEDKCKAICVPGAVRWCDEPSTCNFAKQTCMPDGTWGKCNEVSEHPSKCICPFSPPFPCFYDADCCADSGECCQTAMNSPDSKGNCAGIVVACKP